jgi:colanic acid biosynthesis glycosyl transferase WcaI
MTKITKILFLNQMAGPLFRELAQDLSLKMLDNSSLVTGHPDTLALESLTSKLLIYKAPAYNRKSKLSRVISWVSYSLVAFWHMLRADKNTIIFLVSNPPFLGFFALLINSIRNIQFIVLVYDIYPETLVSFGILNESSLIVKLWKAINQRVWSRSIAVYTIGNIMAENISRQFNVKNSKLGYVGVISPWVDTNKIKPIAKTDNLLSRELNQDDKVTILYSGNMGISHDIDSILKAAKILRFEKNISFLLIGEGQKWQDAVDYQKDNNLTNLQVLPFQPEEKFPYSMSLADIAIVSMDDGAEGLMLPSKMFYYMAVGAAVIGICKGRNDVSNIILDAACGVIIEPKKPEELAASIKKLSSDKEKLNKFKDCARNSVMANFSRNACIEKLNKELLPIIQN